MRLFFLMLVLLAGLAARAQSGAATARPVVPAARPAPLAPDTMAALRRYYTAGRRLRTKVVLGTGGVFVLMGLVGNLFGPERYGGYGGDEVRVFNLTYVSIPIFAGELLYFGQYSRRHERLALEDFQARRLCPELARRLEPKYFAEPAR